jgi:hypothetical protein
MVTAFNLIDGDISIISSRPGNLHVQWTEDGAVIAAVIADVWCNHRLCQGRHQACQTPDSDYLLLGRRSIATTARSRMEQVFGEEGFEGDTPSVPSLAHHRQVCVHSQAEPSQLGFAADPVSFRYISLLDWAAG